MCSSDLLMARIDVADGGLLAAASTAPAGGAGDADAGGEAR